MTTANVNVTKVLLKRGNTVQNNNYTGVSGELTIDTQLKTLRVHDGVTAGGNAITATGAIGSYSNTNTAAYLASQSITSANIGAFQTLANANAAAQATSINTVNANIGAYQTYANSNAATQATSIDSINANVGAYQTFANANAATQTTEINSLRANITAANTAITSLTSNAAIQATLLDTLTGNAVTQSQVLDTLTSNAAAQASSLTTLLGNAVAQQTSLIDLVANAATQAQAIASVTGTYSNANVATYLSAFDGNILPAANVTYSLGSSTRQWKDLWVSNNTIYIGNTPVRVDSGTLLVNGAPVGGSYSNANVAAYLPTYTGNIAGNIVKNGNVWTFGTNGTTTFPTNISIDYSGNNVQFPRIIADTGKAFSVQAQGNIGSAALAWTVNPDAAGQYAAVAVTRGGGDNLAKVVLTAQSDSGDAATAKTWQFNQTGTTRFPGDTILAPAGTSITMQSDQYSQLMWENANVTVAPNMAINSNFYVAQNNATLDIVYRDGSSNQQQKSWLWGVDGSLTLPAGGTITEGGGISGAIRLTPAGGANANQALLIYPTGNAEGDHVHLTAGGGSTELYLGNDFHYVKLVDGGNIELRAATANLSAQAAWTFDTTGNVDTIQALGIKVPDGVPSNVAVINSTTGSWEANPMSNLATTGGSGSGLTVNVTQTGGYASAIAIATAGTGYNNGDLITVTSGTSNATFTIVIGGRNTWQFGTDGATTLPGDIYSGTGAAIKFSKGLEGDVDGAHLQVSNITFLPNVAFEDIPGLNLGLATAPAIGWTMQSIINSWTANGNVNVSSSVLAAPYSDSGNIGIISLGGPLGSGSVVWAGETDRYALSGNTLAYEPYGNIIGLSVGSTANVIITSNVGPVESFRWQFGADGNLTLPEDGTIKFANGVPILDTITGVTSINTSVSTLTVSDASGDYTYGALSYDYAVNGASNSFSIQYSAPLVHGNVDINVGNVSIAGNVVQNSAYYETYANVTNSGGNLTCNFVDGGTFYATLTANVTVNFTNVAATAGQATGATLIVDQGATAYRVANIQINSGSVQTIRWAGGTTNTGTASNTDIMSFSLISLDGTSWRILGQIANYA